MADRDQQTIEMRAIGFVLRASPEEDDRNRDLIAQVVLDPDLAPALDGIEEWSHLYIIFWLDRVMQPAQAQLCQHDNGVGILAARSPIHPNPIGLTLVQLLERDGNVLWVRGLDAYDGTPVLDIKPYPDWEHGHLIVVTDFRIPGWLADIMDQ
jgi:tRNA-Thr(GGU) m(6)t(6)A37 methyltransferase TsaA